MCQFAHSFADFLSEIHGCDIPISIEQILGKIAVRDYEESGVIVLQLLEVHVLAASMT